MNHNDKNLVQGRGQLKVFEEISPLQFAVHSTSPYISVCKLCVAQLWKRRAFKAGLTVEKKFQEIDSSAITTIIYAQFKTRTAGHWHSIRKGVIQTFLFRVKRRK